MPVGLSACPPACLSACLLPVPVSVCMELFGTPKMFCSNHLLKSDKEGINVIPQNNSGSVQDRPVSSLEVYFSCGIENVSNSPSTMTSCVQSRDVGLTKEWMQI